MNTLPLLLLALLWSGPAAPIPARPDSLDLYRMKVRLDVAGGSLDGTSRVRYQNDSGQALREIRMRLDANLDAADSLEIRSVTGSDGATLEWRHLPFRWGENHSEKAHLAVVLPAPLAAGETTSMTLAFRYAHPRAISREMIALQDDPYPSFDAWYPKLMSFRDGAWSIDDDRPSRYEVTLDAPRGIPLATTGTQIAQGEGEEGRAVRTYAADRVRGFTFYGRPGWTVHEREAEGVRLRCFVAKEYESWAPRLLDAAADGIAYYRQSLGPYPTRHLDLITLWAERGGGAFACSNVMGMFLGPGVEDRHRWYIAHEVAHQYFGNLVNQSRRDLYWVVIGLGMLADRSYLLDRGLDDRWHRRMVHMYRQAKKQGRDTRLSQSTAALLAAEPPWSYQWNLVLGHAKAYCVCAMLEDLVGKEPFGKVLREMLTEKAGGLITAADLVDRCEKASGRKLAWFRADWIEGDVSLDYAIGSVQRKGEIWRVEVKRVGDASHPVAVGAVTASGKKLRLRASRDREVQVLEFRTDEELVSVTIDPDRIYPDLDPGNDRWTR